MKKHGKVKITRNTIATGGKDLPEGSTWDVVQLVAGEKVPEKAISDKDAKYLISLKKAIPVGSESDKPTNREDEEKAKTSTKTNKKGKK